MQNYKVAGMALLLAVTVAGVGVVRGEDRESTARMSATQPKGGAALFSELDVKAAAQFLVVERFARLPAAEQTKGLAQFYRELPPRAMSPFVEGFLSSKPTNILDRSSENGFQGNTELWAKQLADAAATQTPEEVDVKLDYLFRQVATRARALQVLKAHEQEVEELIRVDLNSGRKPDWDRAVTIITALKIKTFNEPLLAKLETETDDMSIHKICQAISASEDPNVLPLLRTRVEKDPKYLAKCFGLFDGALNGQPADPLLLKLLDSDDADIRYHAGEAVYDCIDPKLAAGAVRLARGKEPKYRVVGAHLAGNLPPEAFKTVRKDLLPLLEDKDREVLVQGVECFARQKDLAAGPVILQLLKEKAGGSEQQMGTIRGAIRWLTDEEFQKNFKYGTQAWGPDAPGNAEGIELFAGWLEMRTKQDGETK